MTRWLASASTILFWPEPQQKIDCLSVAELRSILPSMNANLMQIHEEAQLMAAACPEALENLIITSFRAGRMTECDIYMFYSPSHWVVTSEVQHSASGYMGDLYTVYLYAEDEHIAQEERTLMKDVLFEGKTTHYFPNTLFPRARGKQLLVLCDDIGHHREVLNTHGSIQKVWVQYPTANAEASVTVEIPSYQPIDGAATCFDYDYNYSSV